MRTKCPRLFAPLVGGVDVVIAIRFTVDKQGRRIAHYFGQTIRRWFRMPLAEAEIMIAMGKAEAVEGSEIAAVCS